MTSGIIGGAYTVTDTGGTGFATVVGGNVVRLANPGGAGFPVSGGGAANNYFVNSSYSTTVTATPGSLVEALSGPVAANTVSVDTTGLASGATLTMATNVLTITSGGGIAFSGANPYSMTASGGGGLNPRRLWNDQFHQWQQQHGDNHHPPILENSVTAVSFAGTGTTVLGGANSYTGGT